MARPANPGEVPGGAAVLPQIPEELGVHPLLLATLNAIVFFDGSDENVVHPAAAEEQLELIAASLQRLSGADLERLREDLTVLSAFARERQWPKSAQKFFANFLSEFGVGES